MVQHICMNHSAKIIKSYHQQKYQRPILGQLTIAVDYGGPKMDFKFPFLIVSTSPIHFHTCYLNVSFKHCIWCLQILFPLKFFKMEILLSFTSLPPHYKCRNHPILKDLKYRPIRFPFDVNNHQTHIYTIFIRKLIIL